MGEIFEDVCKMLLRNLQIPLFREPGTKIGTWWHKDKEIDLVSMNRRRKNRDILNGTIRRGRNTLRSLHDLF